MNRRRCRCLRLCLLLLALRFLLSPCATLDDHGNGSLDSTIRDRALHALVRRRTGIVYDVPLPASLSGVKAAVLRLRSRRLWVDGARIGSFWVPPRTLAAPAVPRLIIVYQHLGSRSSSYYNVKNYSLAAPVLGLLAYDANGTDLDFSVRGDGIVVSFPRVDFPPGMDPGKARCVTFGRRNVQRLDGTAGAAECSTGTGGHFSIVVPEEEGGSAPTPDTPKKRKRKWPAWAVAFAAGAAGLILLCLFVAAIARFARRKKVGEMRRRAEEGEVLEMVWVSGTKMPVASMMRTQPVLENGNAP